MKKEFIAVLLILSMILTPLSGCRGDSTGPTKELLLWVPDFASVSDAIDAFEDKFPDVNVEAKKIDINSDQENLSSALMAGQGPDVILMNQSAFRDLYKVMKNNAFLDLTPLIEAEEDFPTDDYVQAVLEAGQYEGKQYLLPITYDYASYVSEKSLLEEMGLSGLENETDFTAFWKRVIRAAEAAEAANPDFRLPVANISKKMFLENSGLILVDRATGAVLPDREGLKSLTEIYKSLAFDHDYLPDAAYISGGELSVRDLTKDRECILFRSRNFMTYEHFNFLAAYIRAVGEPVSLPCLSVTGGTMAYMDEMVAINNAAKNQYNAWEFVKLYCDMTVEENGAYYQRLTARKSGQRVQPNVGQWVGEETGVAVSFTQEEIDEYLQQMQAAETCTMQEDPLWEIYRECMEPYCRGEAYYGFCVNQLEAQLTLYIME